jgi:hypothetical protein
LPNPNASGKTSGTLTSPNDNIHNQEIIDFLQHDQVTKEPAIMLTPKEIKKEISYLNNKKAPGLDQISAKMMKELPKKGIVMLTYYLMLF